MNWNNLDGPRRFIFLAAAFLLISCSKDYRISVKDHAANEVQRIQVTYSKPKKGVRLIYAAVERGDYQTALVHGQFFLKVWPKHKKRFVVEDLVVISSLLRMRTVEQPDLKNIFKNNAYVAETLEMMQEFSSQSDNPISKLWMPLLQQGSVHTLPFYRFLEGMRSLVAGHPQASARELAIIRSSVREWYDFFAVQELENHYKSILDKR